MDDKDDNDENDDYNSDMSSHIKSNVDFYIPISLSKAEQGFIMNEEISNIEEISMDQNDKFRLTNPSMLDNIRKS